MRFLKEELNAIQIAKLLIMLGAGIYGIWWSLEALDAMREIFGRIGSLIGHIEYVN